MLKYVDTKVVFEEIPDEISLAISISNCPCNCNGCHSSYLAKDIGTILGSTELMYLINQNKGITCICFMGGDRSPITINELACLVKEVFPNIKVAWYSGRDTISEDINVRNFDYIKVGSYKESYGPLTSRSTNQRLYKVVHNNSIKLYNITYKFWK